MIQRFCQECNEMFDVDYSRAFPERCPHCGNLSAEGELEEMRKHRDAAIQEFQLLDAEVKRQCAALRHGTTEFVVNVFADDMVHERDRWRKAADNWCAKYRAKEKECSEALASVAEIDQKKKRAEEEVGRWKEHHYKQMNIAVESTSKTHRWKAVAKTLIEIIGHRSISRYRELLAAFPELKDLETALGLEWEEK